MSSNLAFNEWVRYRRKLLDMTQQALAYEVECTVSMIQKVEAGQRYPSPQLAERLVSFLDIPAGVYVPPESPPQSAPDSRPRAGARPSLTPGRSLAQALTPLLGRDAEVTQLLAFLGRQSQATSVRLLTLTGPGGIGKTRLAFHLADLLVDDFADGVVVLDLTPLRDSQLVIPSLVRALGLPEPTQETALTTLIAALQDQHMLLLVDNFEHVIPAAAAIAELLAYCLHITILVTSREALHIHGEQQYQVPPLAVRDSTSSLARAAASPAVALFVARAQAVDADFQLTAENTAAVVRICERLDGLPLAIELAAARTRVLPPAMLLERLDHRLDVLKQRAVNLAERHQTLRSAIDWSYQLLTPGEQQIFRRSAIFVGGMSLAAAEAVIPLSELDPDSPASITILEDLEALMDKSLLRCEVGPQNELRFQMLETIREYGVECLQASGEQQAVAAQHATYFLQLAETAAPLLKGPDQRIWLTRLAQEHPNLRAALTWTLIMQPEQALRLSGALASFWYVHGHLREGRQWLQAALDQGSTALVSARASALFGLGLLAFAQGEYAVATSAYEAALVLRRELGDPPGIVELLNNLGIIAMQRGEYAQAASLYEASVVLGRESGDRWGLANALSNLGILATNQVDFEHAERSYQEALVLREQLGDIWGHSSTLNHLGEVAYYQGDYARASDLLGQSLTLARQIHDEARQAFIFETQARVRLAQGDPGAARQVLTAGIRIRRRLGQQYPLVTALETFAVLLLAEGQPAQAAIVLGRAAALREELGTPPSIVHQRQIDATRAATLQQLGEQEFAAAWQAGLTVPINQLLDQLLVGSELE